MNAFSRKKFSTGYTLPDTFSFLVHRKTDITPNSVDCRSEKSPENFPENIKKGILANEDALSP